MESKSPAADFDRRFARSLHKLFNTFSAKVDVCRCFMNCDATPELVFEQHGDARDVVHSQYYQHLLKLPTPVEGVRDMIDSSAPPSPEALAILQALQTAVSNALEKKRRLGQYAVFWQDGQPVKVWGDALKTSS